MSDPDESQLTQKHEVGHVAFRLHQVDGLLVLSSEVAGLDPVDALSVIVEGAHQYLDEVRAFATPAYRMAANLHRIAGEKHPDLAEDILQAILKVAEKYGLAEAVAGALDAERLMRDLDKAREASRKEPPAFVACPEEEWCRLERGHSGDHNDLPF